MQTADSDSYHLPVDHNVPILTSVIWNFIRICRFCHPLSSCFCSSGVGFGAGEDPAGERRAGVLRERKVHAGHHTLSVSEPPEEYE
jgi:hypothetical protein